MKRKSVVVIFAILLSLSFMDCRKTSDEDELAAIVAQIQKAVEEKNTNAIMKHVSPGYSDSQGFDYETLKKTLRAYFFRFPKISAYINRRDISVSEGSARIILQAILTSGVKTGSLTDAIPESLGIYIFDISLRKESNDWKIITATWKRAGVNSAGHE